MPSNEGRCRTIARIVAVRITSSADMPLLSCFGTQSNCEQASRFASIRDKSFITRKRNAPKEKTTFTTFAWTLCDLLVLHSSFAFHSECLSSRSPARIHCCSTCPLAHKPSPRGVSIIVCWLCLYARSPSARAQYCRFDFSSEPTVTRAASPPFDLSFYLFSICVRDALFIVPKLRVEWFVSIFPL